VKEYLRHGKIPVRLLSGAVMQDGYVASCPRVCTLPVCTYPSILSSNKPQFVAMAHRTLEEILADMDIENKILK
jgi:hypothetical protein